MLSKINPFAFFIAFAIGMLFIYAVTPTPEVVMKFPSPWNSGKIVYTSDTDNSCYVYRAKKSECPIDNNLIYPQPLNSD